MNLNRELRVVMLGIVLALICGICAAAMAYAVSATEKPIAEAKAQRLVQGFRTVLPAFDNDIEKTVEKIRDAEVFTATMKGKTVGYAVRAKANGYGGVVEGLVGFSPEGKITTFIITGHNETPGLGSQAADRVRKKTIFTLFKGEDRTGLPPNRFLDSFCGRHAKDAGTAWQVKKDGGTIDAVTGATISSRAVSSIACRAAEALVQIRKGK